MKICPKCKKQYESGNFCEDCENEDGSPVKLEEEKITCPKCGRQYDKGTKFCSECGIRLGAAVNKGSTPGGVSMGDKNVIAGDVTGHKEETNISGNATIIHNEDETKKTARCHICGSVVLRMSGYDCPDCGEFTCEECFDRTERVCRSCVSTHIKNKEQQYKMKVIEFLSNDGKIDAQEFAALEELAGRLGISAFRASQIQNEVRSNSSAKEFTTFEKFNLNRAEELFYGDGKTEEALKLVEPVYGSHSTEEKVLSLYLPILAEKDDKKAKAVIDSLQFDSLSAYLAAIQIAVKTKDLNTAEHKLQRAEKMWPESTLLKCHKVLYLLAFYDYTKDKNYADMAAGLLSSPGEAGGKLELSWQMKVQCMVSEAQGNTPLALDRDFCSQNNLYYEFMQSNPLASMEEIKRKAAAAKLPHDMVYVEGGKLTIGSDDNYRNPKHEVELDSFYISRYEVTQELYESVTGENPSEYKGSRRPVEYVSWYDAVEFCNKLSLKEGLRPCYKIDKNNKDPYNTCKFDDIKWTASCDFAANGYRLPTEAEWEYAARGGLKSSGFKYAGSSNIDEVAWYDGNSGGETHDVGKKKPNELGLYDMTGNVCEWCWDWYRDEIQGGKNPRGAGSGSYRVGRGGSWICVAGSCAVSFRDDDDPSFCNYFLGFRVVRSSSK